MFDVWAEWMNATDNCAETDPVEPSNPVPVKVVITLSNPSGVSADGLTLEAWDIAYLFSLDTFTPGYCFLNRHFAL